MEITVTPDQAMLIRQAIEAGRIHRPEDAAEEAMALWQEYERRRAATFRKADKGSAGKAPDDGSPAAAVARILELRKGNVLPADVTLRDLLTHGRA